MTPSHSPSTAHASNKVHPHSSIPAAERLGELSQTLRTITDFSVKLVHPQDGIPHLLVTNSGATHLTERIGCFRRDGRIVFTWSWDETICDADDVSNATDAIMRVLTIDA